MAEALLVDQAKANDRFGLLLGRRPSEEEALRAILAGDPDSDEDGGGPVETTNIVNFADWLSGVATVGGDG